MHWHKAISTLATEGQAYVIATVLATSGSAPRPAGTKMVIANGSEHDTLGGGQLEHLVIAKSRDLLAAQTNTQHIEHFPLAAAALQCCGGSVTVLFECFATPELHVAVFGAGHIGQRSVGLLEELGARITWTDDASRTPEGDLATSERSTACHRAATPTSVITDLAEQTHVVIVTHDHQLDYALLVSALQRGIGQFASVGVIGSSTKWQRFRARLTADGFAVDDIDKIRCPLGAGAATDKQPTAIAIAIVAELLNIAGAANNERQTQQTARSELSWQQIKSALVPKQEQAATATPPVQSVGRQTR